MADNVPTTPGGAMPPRPPEASKVQPKKETVRINLPPKPTSAPTIKLPTLAPGAPPPSVAAASAAAAPAAPRTQPPPATSSGATRTQGPATAAKPAAAPAAAPRPMAPPASSGMRMVDKVLAIVAMVASLAALGCVLYLAFFLKDTAG